MLHLLYCILPLSNTYYKHSVATLMLLTIINIDHMTQLKTSEEAEDDKD